MSAGAGMVLQGLPKRCGRVVVELVQLCDDLGRGCSVLVAMIPEGGLWRLR